MGQLWARLVWVLLLGALVAGCGGPPTPGELKTLDTVCDRAKDGKRVAVEGYLALPDSFKDDKVSAPLLIRAAPQPGGAEIFVWVPYGDGPNTLDKVPDKYSQTDLKVRTKDRAPVGYQDKVRVSGTLVFPAVNPVAATNASVKCGFNTPLVESASQ
jgi:hypothetical protein